MPLHDKLDEAGLERRTAQYPSVSPDDPSRLRTGGAHSSSYVSRGRTRSGTTVADVEAFSRGRDVSGNALPSGLSTSRTVASGLADSTPGLNFILSSLSSGANTPRKDTSRSGHRRIPSDGLGLRVKIPDGTGETPASGAGSYLDNPNLVGSAGRLASSGSGGVPHTAIGSAFPTSAEDGNLLSPERRGLTVRKPSANRYAPPEDLPSATSSVVKLLVHGSNRNDEGRSAFYGNETIVMIDKIPWAQPGDLVSVRSVALSEEERRRADKEQRDLDAGGLTSSSTRTGGMGGWTPGSEGPGAPGIRKPKRKLKGDYLFQVIDPDTIHKQFGATNIRGKQPHLSQNINNTPQSVIPNISISEAVSLLFSLRNRSDVVISKVLDPATVEADHVELLFSGQYLGRQDMWRLGMSLEGRCLYVGQKVEFAGSVRAEVKAIWTRGTKRASGLSTSRTKTIFRSKSAQFYIFIHVCRETYEFDEDGERYYEKALHGFLPELFQRWKDTQANHVVTIILFGRVYYDKADMETLDKLGSEGRDGLMKDERNGHYKDFYQVVVDFETRNEWQSVMPELKRTMGFTLQDILLEHHLQDDEAAEAKIAGRLSFAFEGNVLESINLVLNPFSESYIDRDLSRTGLCVTVITPGTGHFAVDKQLLRMTSERVIDHGVCLDLVCLSQIPLHTTPLFSYWSEVPDVGSSSRTNVESNKVIDPLYVDPKVRDVSKEVLCYAMPYWVFISYYARSHDRPLRSDRFVPRCRMYEVQMMGIMDHDLTTLALPMLPEHAPETLGSDDEAKQRRQATYDQFDDDLFGGGPIANDIRQLETRSRPESLLRAGVSQPSSVGSNKEHLASSYRAAMRRRQDDGPEAIAESPVRLGVRQDIQRPRGSSLISTGSEGQTTKVVSTITANSPVKGQGASHPPLTSIPTVSNERKGISRSSTTSAQTSGGTSSTETSTSRPLKPKASQGSLGFAHGTAALFGRLLGRANPSAPKAAISNVAGNNSPSPKTTTANQALLAAKQHGSPTPSSRSPSATPSTPKARPNPINTLKTPSSPPMISLSITEPVSIPLQGKSRERLPLHRANKDVASDIVPPTPAPNNRMRSDRDQRRGTGRQSRRAETLARSFPGHDQDIRPTLLGSGRTQAKVLTINPLRPLERHGDPFGQSRRWQHAQTRPTFQQDIKWDSMCAPACLPLTNDLVPTLHELQTEFQEQLYPLDSHANALSFLLRTDTPIHDLAIAVMREMASQRLSQNFQFITIPADTPNGPPVRGQVDGVMPGGASDVLRAARGPLYLSASNQVHRLDFAAENRNTLEVHNYARIIRYSMVPWEYKCLVWPRHRQAYQPAAASFRYPTRHNDFNYLDRLIIGAEEELTDSIRYWRTRFILIPSDKSALRENSLPGGDTLKAEENQIYGAQKVLELVAKLRWKKDDAGMLPQPKLLMTWLAPSACVADTRLMQELEVYHKSMAPIAKNKPHKILIADYGTDALAQASSVAAVMRDPANGLAISDRRWHSSIYYDSFVGEAFVSWLLTFYGDFETREEAVGLGNNLMKYGVIEHSRGEHNFMDGYYFYRLTAEYGNRSSKRKKAFGWFTKGFLADDIESAPELIGMPTKPASSLGSMSGIEGVPLRGKRRKIRMSQTMVLDLDERRKSDRAEVAILHSDIVHNPANALHFELNWIGVTAGLLDEVRQKWSREAEKWGLRLVEAPVEQILDVGKKCAYRACVPINLAIAPPAIVDLDLRLPEAIRTTNFFEYALLTKKFDFVLDVEASSRYPDGVQVEYTYRKEAFFEYSQFVHKSGVALVQCIGGTEGFIWSDNRLFFGSSTRNRPDLHTGKTTGETNQEMADTLRRSMEEFCSDAKALAAFYESEIPPLLTDSVDQLEPEKDEKDLTRADQGIEILVPSAERDHEVLSPTHDQAMRSNVESRATTGIE